MARHTTSERKNDQTAATAPTRAAGAFTPEGRFEAAQATPRRSLWQGAPDWNFAAVPVRHTQRSIQPHLKIGAVDDPWEREAEALAQQVTRTHENPALSGSAAFGDVPTVRAKSASAESNSPQPGQTMAPPIIHDVIGQSGQPLSAGDRRFMEARLGRDFSDVQVHTGPLAARSAESVAANAYTVGSHVVFGEGRYEPGSGAGRRLLAHELVHVMQQSSSASAWSARVMRDPAKPTPIIFAADQLVKAKEDFALTDAAGKTTVKAIHTGDLLRIVSDVGDTKGYSYSAIVMKNAGEPELKAGKTQVGVLTASKVEATLGIPSETGTRSTSVPEKSAGTLAHSGDLNGGKVKVRTGVEFSDTDKDDFAVSYRGPGSADTHILQFISREVVAVNKDKSAHPVTSTITTTGGTYDLTPGGTDSTFGKPGKANVNTDTLSHTAPFYESNESEAQDGASRTADSTTIYDLPGNLSANVQGAFTAGGANVDHVVSRAHFVDYVIQKDNVVYRTELNLQWVFNTAGDDPKRESKIGAAGAASKIDSPFKEKFDDQWPAFKFIK
jgi:Domain of unknown function (DUF4157)